MTSKCALMAKNKKVTKSLTVPQMDLLKLLDEEEIVLFTADTAREFAPNTENLNEIVENLVRKGFLYRLERGKYCRFTFRDEYVIGTFIVPEGAIAYWSALNLYGLTEQFPNTVFVQTTCKKKTVSVFGTTYRFVKVNPQKRIGIEYNGYGNHKYPVTDIEKTVVDCFDLPQYSGGYAELIRAFYRAELNAERLINYCTVVNNRAVIKRLGFLSELFDKKELLPFTEFARSKVNRTYNMFDPFGENTGAPESKWYLRLNLSLEAIKAISNHPY
jgi:predicted transcriptional regulator of viral defense system